MLAAELAFAAAGSCPLVKEVFLLDGPQIAYLLPLAVGGGGVARSRFRGLSQRRGGGR